MRAVLAMVDDEGVRRELEAAVTGLGHVIGFDPAAHADVVLVDISAGGATRAKLDLLLGEIDAPAIFVANNLDDDVLDATSSHGPAAFLLRPIAPRELGAAIELAVHRSLAARRAATRERWYQTTLRSIGDAVITADDDSTITFINPTAQALTGWSEEEGLGQPLDDVFAVENDDSADSGAAEPGGPVLRLRRRDGSHCIVEHNAAPIVDAGGALHGVVVVFRDITERRRIEQRLALSGRMTSIGTLAAGIAHELNNPLAFVTSNLDFVIGELETMKSDPRRAWSPALIEDSLTALREAADGASRAAQIVKDMKVFIRGDAEPKTVVDVNRALSFAARLTNNEVRHVGELEVHLEQVPATLADEGQLVQVFVNLLTNAAQAIDPRKEQKQIRVSSKHELGRVVVRIEDSGSGIAPEHLGRVFEPFFTTKPVGQGLGLGLSISHTIITSFGGTISLDSELGRGTTVILSLPTTASRTPALALPPSITPRILVIDDEALIGTAVRRILSKHNYDVVVEQDGRRALDLLSAGGRFDVIVCDLMMPGFSGVDFYHGLLSDLQSRVILMTGNAFTPRARELFESTKNVRLEKPFLPNDLLGAVAEVLNRHGP